MRCNGARGKSPIDITRKPTRNSKERVTQERETGSLLIIYKRTQMREPCNNGTASFHGSLHAIAPQADLDLLEATRPQPYLS